jgi:hypothetical protein
MGRVINLPHENFGILQPSQRDLSERKVLSALAYKFKDKSNILLPEGIIPHGPPAVVRIEPKTQRLVIIDGHHRLCIADLFGDNYDLFVADNNLDYMTPEIAPALSEEQLFKSNDLIRARFDQVLINYNQIKCPRKIRQLREKYETLGTKDLAEYFFRNDFVPFREVGM